MAENDGEVRIQTTLDTKDLDKQINDVKSKLQKSGKEIDNGSKQVNNFAGSLKKVAAGAAGFTAVAVAAKKTVDILEDCAAAYRVQERAEKALELAAKNNPYLNSENVYNLKQFASELQSMSEVGDEVSIQVMSQLAAAGRTQSEIIQIMSAAADMAAATGQDIGSVAQQLNATLNGSSGTLGRQITGLKDLTEEELKSGKAIELVAKQYKGSAAELADTTVQLSNAWGDFKENIGAGWNKVTAPVKQFLLDTLNKVNEIVGVAGGSTDQYADLTAAMNGSNNINVLENAIEIAKEQIQSYNDDIVLLYRDTSTLTREQKKQQKELIDLYSWAGASQDEVIKEAVAKQREQIALLEDEIKGYKDKIKLIQEEAETQKLVTTQKEKDAKAQEMIDASNKALNENLAALKLRAELTGENINEQDIYNLYLESYIELLTKSEGLISENNSVARARLKILEDQAKKAREAADAEERLAEAEKAKAEAESLIDDLLSNENYYDEYKRQQEQLLEYQKTVNESEVLSEEEKAEKIEEINKALMQSKKEMYASLMSDIEDYTEQTVQISKDAAALMIQNTQAQSDAELLALEERYQKGEMEETEYYEKQKQIKRKAAQEEYKIKMFEWTASLLAATANVAEGVTKAIAQGGVMGIINGALVGASGMLQIASITAARPTPPNFWQGGFIGGMNGASMGGDNTYIHARTGELVINAAQQRHLWDMLNGQQQRGDMGSNITVNNTQSNVVDTDVRNVNGETIIDILDKHINNGLTTGIYDAGLAGVNIRNEGVRIL